MDKAFFVYMAMVDAPWAVHRSIDPIYYINQERKARANHRLLWNHIHTK
ncbi:hypothetical protein ACFQDF_31450 [Ectobacillus funiculus]